MYVSIGWLLICVCGVSVVWMVFIVWLFERTLDKPANISHNEADRVRLGIEKTHKDLNEVANKQRMPYVITLN
jgi:hypothetical protein